MNTKKKQLLIEMLDECFNGISDHDDHNKDWRNLANNEEDALRQACRDVLFSNYAYHELSADFFLNTAFDLLINGYEECAA